MISTLLNLLRCILWPGTCSVLVNVLCVLKKTVFSTVVKVVYRCQLYTIVWWTCWIQTCPHWFSAVWICTVSDRRVLTSPARIVDLPVSPWQFCQFLPHRFGCSTVRHRRVKDCYILENCPLRYDEMVHFTADNFALKPYLSEINIAVLICLWVIQSGTFVHWLLISVCLYIETGKTTLESGWVWFLSPF